MRNRFSMPLLTGMCLTACGGKNAIVGTWVSEEDSEDVLIFDEDGTCVVPFTYNSSWWESADHYIITKENGTLVLSSKNGHADDSFEKADSEEAALKKGNRYYLSGDTLIIKKRVYERQ